MQTQNSTTRPSKRGIRSRPIHRCTTRLPENCAVPTYWHVHDGESSLGDCRAEGGWQGERSLLRIRSFETRARRAFHQEPSCVASAALTSTSPATVTPPIRKPFFYKSKEKERGGPTVKTAPHRQSILTRRQETQVLNLRIRGAPQEMVPQKSRQRWIPSSRSSFRSGHPHGQLWRAEHHSRRRVR